MTEASWQTHQMKALASILMGEWAPSSEVESLIIWLGKLLQGQSWAIICHGVKPQAYNPLSTKLYVNKYCPHGGVLKQVGHCHGWPHDLIWVYDFLAWDAGHDWHLATFHRFFPPQGLCDLCEPRQKAWGLVVGHGLDLHKLPGWSGWYLCLCGSLHGSGGRLPFAVGHR